MNVTIRDLLTGKERTKEVRDDPFWWSEGSGSCDCNRVQFFPEHDQHEGEDVFGCGTCRGTKRYIVTAIEPMPEGYILADFNDGYPEQK